MRQWFAEVTYWSYVAFIKWTHAMKYSTVGPVCEPTCSMWIEQVWIAPSRYVTNELAVFAMCMLLQVRYYTVHKVMFQCLRVHSWHMSLLLKPNIYSTWGEWKQSLYVAQDRALAYTVIHDTPSPSHHWCFIPLFFSCTTGVLALSLLGVAGGEIWVYKSTDWIPYVISYCCWPKCVNATNQRV